MVSIAKALNVSLDSLVFSDISKRDNIQDKLMLNLGGEVFIKQDYPSEDEKYYWIYEYRLIDKTVVTGGATMFVGWKDDNHEIELRVLRPVKPLKFISFLRDSYGHTPLIVNSLEDLLLFYRYGGNALVREDIYKDLMEKYYGPYEKKSGYYSETTSLTKEDIWNSRKFDIDETYIYDSSSESLN